MTRTVILVHAGQLIQAHDKPPITDGAVAVVGEKIEAVGNYQQLSAKYPEAKVIGGDRFLLIPGLINGHGHGRGLSDFQRGASDNTLESWLLEARKYIPISLYDDRAYSAARLLKAGVTTTMDNHILQDPSAFSAEYEQVLQAYSDAGMRVQFNPAIRDKNPFIYGDNEAFLASLPAELKTALTTPVTKESLTAENFVKVVRDLHACFNSPMIRIGFGPLAPQWCTRDLLVHIRRTADSIGAPIHVHGLQSIFQKIYGLKFLGKTLIKYMNDIGFLGPGLVIGHCVWPTESDIDLLAQTGTGVTHHPSCNLRVRNGISPVFHMLQAGVAVGLGLDGKSINDDDNMIQEMKLCFLLHRIPSLELNTPYLSARQVFQMATETNASLLGYARSLGRLEPGRLADLLLLDFRQMTYPYVDPSQDPIETLLYRGKGEHVHTVMVNGRIVVQEGRLLTLDEEDIGSRIAEQASRPRTEKEKAALLVLDALKTHIIKYYRGWAEEVEVDPYFPVNSKIDGMKPK